MPHRETPCRRSCLQLAAQNQTIAANIAAQYPEANDLGVSTLIGTGLILFLITFVVNFIARKLTEKATA